jgi:hypothetical protein
LGLKRSVITTTVEATATLVFERTASVVVLLEHDADATIAREREADATLELDDP